MINDCNYSYELLTSSEEACICAQIVSDSFTKLNVITMSHGVIYEQHFESISYPMINKILDEQLSFFARHRKTQEIVGCVTAGDYYLKRFHHQPYTGFYSLGNLIEELDEMFINNLDEELKPNMILHIELVAIKQSELEKGLATRLCQFVCKHAHQTRDFRYEHVKVTHPATNYIFLKKINDKIVSEIDPTKWV